MLSGKEKAAIFLSVIGGEYSGKLLDYLPPDVANSIAEILSKGKKRPSNEEIVGIIGEFEDYVSKIVINESDRAVAEEGGGTEGKGAGSPLKIITRSSPVRIAAAIRDERPEIIAFILSHMSAEKIYAVLPMLGDIRRDVEERLLHMKDVPMTDVFQDQVLDIVAKRLM